jgi:NAD(P)-dependent dehydrogenase (short-subunit alcohol dehydrogenase family)
MKTTIITGCTSGIGLITANELAQAGHNLILVSRNHAKLEEITKEYSAKYPSQKFSHYACDFENLQDVENEAKKIASEHTEIDILINNAALWEDKYRENPDGFEITWTVNYFAPFIFTHHLLPRLKEQMKKTADVRIINVGSEGHRFGILDLEKLNVYHFQKTYGLTKLADMMWTFKLSRKLANTGITVNTLHPGVIATGLWRKLPKAIAWILSKVLISSEDCAKTTLFLATQPELKTTGEYFSDCKIAKASKQAMDVDHQNLLYEFTIEKLKKYLN